MKRTLFWFCFQRARFIIRRVKKQYPNSSNIFAQDPEPRSGNILTSETIQNIIKNLPAYMEVVNSQIAPEARAKLASEKEISPQYQELLTSLYEQFAPRLAKAGAVAEGESRKGSAATDVELLGGSGGRTVRELSALDKEVNPEYYATRAAGANKLGQLLGSIDLNAPNIEAERLVSQEASRSGNAAVPSATGTVSNALSFGNELQKRRDALGQAINIASGFLAPASGTFNTANIALGKGPTNTGLTNFAGVKDTTSSAGATAGGLLGVGAGLVGQEQDIEAQRRDWVDRINESIGSIP